MKKAIKTYYYRYFINYLSLVVAMLSAIYCYWSMPECFKSGGKDLKTYLGLLWKRENWMLYRVQPRFIFLGLSDPLSIPWIGTSDYKLAHDFHLSDFGISLFRASDYKYFYFILFCGYLKRQGLFEEVLEFSEPARNSSDSMLQALALREKADILHLYYRWYQEQREPIEAGTYFRLSDYFPDKINPGCRYEASFPAVAFDDVLKLYQDAIYASPEIPWLYYEIGNLYRYQERFNVSLEYYDKAISLGAGVIVKVYAAQAAYFHNRDEQTYYNAVKSIKSIEEGRKYPSIVRFTTLEKLHGSFDSIGTRWPAEPVELLYRAAYRGELVSVTKTLQFPAKGVGHFNHLRKLSHPFSVVNDTYMLTDTIHFHPPGYKMFNTHLLEYDQNEACVFYRNKGKNITEQHIKSPVILLGGRITRPDYYHSIYDAFGSLALIEDQGFLADREIIIGEKTVKWLQDIIADLNLPNKIKLLEQTNDNSSAIVYEDVIQLACPSYMSIPHPRVIDFLRRRLCPQPQSYRKGRFIHFARSKSRVLHSEARSVFYKFLEDEGFEIVDPGQMSIDEQRDLLKDVEIVSAEGGAALSNLIYCPEGAKVIVIAPSTHIFEVFSVIAHQLKQKLWYCIEDVNGTYPNPYFLWSSVSLDVDIPTFKACLIEAKQC